MTVPVLLKQESLKNEGLVGLLERLLVEAREGELVGALIIVEERNAGYRYERSRIGFEKALGLHSRAIFKLNEDWNRG